MQILLSRTRLGHAKGGAGRRAAKKSMVGKCYLVFSRILFVIGVALTMQLHFLPCIQIVLLVRLCYLAEVHCT